MSLLDRLERQKSTGIDETTAVDTPLVSKNVYDEKSELKERIHKEFIEIVNQQDISLFN